MIGRVSMMAAMLDLMTRALVRPATAVYSSRVGPEKGPRPPRSKFTGEALRAIRANPNRRECIRRRTRGW